MYKVLVNVSAKRARLVPKGVKAGVADRSLGEISQSDALNNKDALVDGIRGMLADRGLLDADLFSVDLPDELAPDQNNRPLPEGFVDNTLVQETTNAKGAITKVETPIPAEVPPEEEPETKRATDAARKVKGDEAEKPEEQKDA
jgi:hypothetical protein